MDKNETLSSYTEREINKGVELPEIQNDVHNIEIARVDKQLDSTALLHHELISSANENVEICVLGSNGMYLLFEGLRGEGQELQILSQRCEKGKNDFDFGIDSSHARRVTEIWEFEEFTRSEQDRNTSGHGRLKGSSLVVDLLPREKIKGFEWIPITYKGETMHVQTPEEMIFEKLHSLARGIDHDPKLKWGIDIKILKYYLQQTKGFNTEEEVNDYLSRRWDEFETAQIVGRYNEITTEVNEGNNVRTAYSKFLNIDPSNLEQTLIQQSGLGLDELRPILDSTSGEEFIDRILTLYKNKGLHQPYSDLYKKAEDTFKKVI